MKHVLAAILCLATAGCASLNMLTAARLRTMDPLSVDPAKLTVVTRVPDWMDAAPRSTMFSITTVPELNRPKEIYYLVSNADAANLGTLKAEQRPGTRLISFRFDEADLPRLRTTLAELRRLRGMRPGRSNGEMAVTPAKPCAIGAVQSGPILISGYISVEGSDNYMTLMTNYDLRSDPSLPANFTIEPCA